MPAIMLPFDFSMSDYILHSTFIVSLYFHLHVFINVGITIKI